MSTRTRLGLDEEEESEKPILEGKNVKAFERWSVYKGERELTINTTLRLKSKTTKKRDVTSDVVAVVKANE